MPENINSDSKIAGTSAGYVIKTHFKGDTENVTGPRCQFRRYVVDVYIENCKAKSGSFKLKEEADVSSRCMPFDATPVADTCVCCGRAAKKLVYWGKAY